MRRAIVAAFMAVMAHLSPLAIAQAPPAPPPMYIAVPPPASAPSPNPAPPQTPDPRLAAAPAGALPMYAPQLPPPGWQPPPGPQPPPVPPQEILPPPEEQVVEIGPTLAAPSCPPPKLWEGSVEFGLNGSEGNSEVFNFRLGTNAKRKTPLNELSLSLLYTKNSQDGVETANRAFLEGRNEWLQPDSPWTRFVHGTGEYDEFRAFDFRIAADAGWGYAFVKNPATTLIGRFGPGFSHEMGGPDDSIVPEAVLGIEFEHKFSERQKLIFSSTWYPDLSDFGEYRANSKAGWEMVVDPAWGLNLQLSVLNRYDSTPNGADPNDIDYSLLLIWAF